MAGLSSRPQGRKAVSGATPLALIFRPAERGAGPAALQHLCSLAPLDTDARDMTRRALRQMSMSKPRQEMVREGAATTGRRLMASGWAARVRILPDGRQQLLALLVPGDTYGSTGEDPVRAPTGIVAVTRVETCQAPLSPLMDRAYAEADRLEQAYLFDHLVRLGRMCALDRMCSLLLELNGRLERNGLARDGQFELPLTQDLLADLLGLTSVHVNRVLKAARQAGRIEQDGRLMRIVDPVGLARQLG